MLISLGDNQFLSVNGVDLPTRRGYVGHHLDEEAIPEGVVEVRSGEYHDGIDKFIAAPRVVMFKGSKAQFLLWQEEHNGW